jgi:hypothetical protein
MNLKIVVTLAEGSYFQGACVLFNSLVAHGFEGIFVAGCRNLENVPSAQRSAIEAFRRSTSHSNTACWEWFVVETTWHFTNYKPRFLLEVLDAYPECTSIVYLDPDIVVCSPWHWIEEATEFGPVVAGDVNWWLFADHPTRHQWLRMIEQAGYRCEHSLDFYFNGGLLGIQRRDQAFLELWHHFIEVFGASTNPLDGKGDIGAWRGGGRWNAMHTPDQDALNMAAMAWPNSLSTFGPDLMGFTSGWIGLPHALGSAKPWRRRYLREALVGDAPRRADKEYWAHAAGPITVYRSRKIRLKQIFLKLAALIGRLYKKY